MSQHRYWLTWFFTLVFCSGVWGLWESQAQASDFHSPRTAALGGSGHAGPLTNDAIYLNPSYSSFVNAYSISGSYSNYGGSAPNHGRLLNFSIIDGRSPLFQAGVGYTMKNDNNWLHIGASKAVLERLSVGLSGKLVMENGKPVAKDAGLSSSYILSEWAQTSLTFDNLFEEQKSQKFGLQRQIIIGSKFVAAEMLMFYVDPSYSPNVLNGDGKLGLEVGFEWTVVKDFFARTGYFRNSPVPYEVTRGRGFGLGAGWVGPRISLDYAYQKVLGTTSSLPSSTLHVFGTTIYF